MSLEVRLPSQMSDPTLFASKGPWRPLFWECTEPSHCEREKRTDGHPKSITLCPHGQWVPPTELTNVQPTRCPEWTREAESSALGSSSRERTFIWELQMIASISLVSFWWMFTAPIVIAFCYLAIHLSIISLLLFIHLLWLAMFLIESTHSRLIDHTKQCCW